MSLLNTLKTVSKNYNEYTHERDRLNDLRADQKRLIDASKGPADTFTVIMFWLVILALLF